MHQGNSFTEEAAAIASRKGLTLVALTSRPERESVFEANQAFLADWIMTGYPELTMADADGAVEAFSDRGFKIVAALATFEGYRVLMASLNQALDAPDSSPSSLMQCLNKFEMRHALADRGLSEVGCHRIEPGKRPPLDPRKRWFLKPVRGASSFASFVLESRDDLADLEQIQDQMRADHRMRAIFMGQFGFLAEEYIDGPEFSFEIIVVDGVHPVCIHEKARVEEHRRTTLEGMSISPPVSVGKDCLLEGAGFVAACLNALDLRSGAFHVEAKYWLSRGRWEIIEINPRMGGSLINASVTTVTGVSNLELWIDSLLARTEEERGRLRQRLDDLSQVKAIQSGGSLRATVFLSKYGEKGRTVKSIRFSPGERMPQVLKVHVSPGTALENSDRAICLLDALWQVEPGDMIREVEALDRLAREHFEVDYQ
ncbi:MAG: ATP-grasp domain-containing protein [Methanobacterium sp.]|nr:ATP-grasp domain-containing protein [Methanobacterium sp.]